MGRHRLLLGHEHNGDPVSLAVRGRSILIAGEPGSGKSLLGGLICEQLILQGYSVCVIDPEGDYRTLAAFPGVSILGVSDPLPTARDLARALRHPDVSVVIDLSKISHHEKIEYVGILLPQLMALRRRTGLPHKILLDEAHYFLGHGIPRTSDRSGARGLHRGDVPPLDARSDFAHRWGHVALVTRESDPVELETLLDLCGPQPDPTAAMTAFGDLQLDEAALVPGAEESRGTIRRFRLTPRLTPHVRHRSKDVDMPVLAAHAFVFNDNGHPGARASTLKEFVHLLGTVPMDRLEGHIRRHDFSRWVNDVFRDRPFASHLAALESRVATDEARCVVESIAQAIRARYEASSEG